MFTTYRGENIYKPPETIDEILEAEKLGYVEQDPLREDELKDPHRMIKIELLGIIATYQDPVCCNRIFKDYYEMNGVDLDPRDYGFKNFSSMMRTFSDKFIHHKDGERTLYTAKTTERSAHLQDLIQNQITPEEKRQRDLRRARSYSRPRNGGRNGGMQYGAAFNYYAQKFVPVHNDDRTLEERTADNLASFGRSLAAAAARGGDGMSSGIDWSGRGRSRAAAVEEQNTATDDEERERMSRSRSAPPPRAPQMFTIISDPTTREEDLADCTNPFRVQNNIRIRDIIIDQGEKDEEGRKGLALADVTTSFKVKHRQPLGGIPGLTVESLFKRMSAIKTDEWTVERMGDDVVYVIVPVDTVEWREKVGPGTAVKPRAQWDEKPEPRPTVTSPAAKRMLAHALNGAISHNGRLSTTRESVVDARLDASPPPPSPSEVVDSDDDVPRPIVVASSDGDPMLVDPPLRLRAGSIDRATMMAANVYATLDPQLARFVYGMRLLRGQQGPVVASSSSSSASSSSGSSVASNNAPSPPKEPLTRSDTSATASGMFSTPGRQVPSFGTFKNNSQPPPPTQPSLAASSDDRDDSSEIMQPAASNLAGMLPQKSFGASQPTTTPSSSFPSSFGGSSAAAAPPSKNLLAGRSMPMFGTGSQGLRPNMPSFGTTSAAAPTTTQSAFGGAGENNKPAAPSFGTTSAVPRKMVEVIEEKPMDMSELLGETIQLIGKLRSGEKVLLKSIEGTPLEDVIAGNPDFFDVDEDDERIHLLHSNVDPRLLTVDGKALGEGKEEKKEVKPTVRASFSRPAPSFAPAPTRPTPPSFSSAAPPSRPAEPETKPTPAPSMSSFGRPIPTFGRPAELENKPRDTPVFGASARQMEEKPRAIEEMDSKPVMAPAPAPVPEVAKPLAGMPSFGTRSGNVISDRSEQVRAAPAFGSTTARKEQRPSSVMSERKDSSVDSSRPESVMSNAESTTSNAPSVATLVLTPEEEEEHMQVEAQLMMAKEEEMRVERMSAEANKEYPFPTHEGIRQLWKTASFAFDAVKKGEIHMASVLTSYFPNRLLLTWVNDKAEQMDILHKMMNELRPLYVDRRPLGSSIQLGQLAIAINSDVIVRVVVLRKSEDEYECACLDINAVITTSGNDLFELDEKFGVDQTPSSTFIARLAGVKVMGAVCHKAIDLVAKYEEGSDDIKRRQPVVFHEIDKELGELYVDVLANVGGDNMWLGETFAKNFGAARTDVCPINPDISCAIKHAVKMGVEGYEVFDEEEREEACTPTADDVVHFEKEEEKPRPRADSYSSTNTSEETTVDLRAAGDYVVRPMKDEVVDEFVVVAPASVKAIIDVESMKSIVRSLHEEGESIQAESIKSITRALILMVNRKLADEGDRAAVIANAEALDVIDNL